MEIKQLGIEHLDGVLAILRQDTLRYSDGNYPDAVWISHFLTDEPCVSLGLFAEGEMVSILICEKLTFKGSLMWFLATAPHHQKKGYGRQLLHYFETNAHSFDIEWVFLNATKESLSFYKKEGYLTSDHSKVWEHYKDLT